MHLQEDIGTISKTLALYKGETKKQDKFVSIDADDACNVGKLT